MSNRRHTLFAAAALMNFGARRTLLSALFLLAFATGASLLMTEPWQLVLTWGVMVVIGAGTVSLPLATAQDHDLDLVAGLGGLEQVADELALGDAVGLLAVLDSSVSVVVFLARHARQSEQGVATSVGDG